MDAGAESIIRRLQANFPVRAAAVAVTGCWRENLKRTPERGCALQEATSEASGRIISEEVLRFIKEGGGGEVCPRQAVCAVEPREALPVLIAPEQAQPAADASPSPALFPAQAMQDQDISYLEDAIRNRLASRTGASGKAERLAATKSLFSNDEWSRISLFMALMERKDESQRAAAESVHKREVHSLMAGQVAEAQKRKYVAAVCGWWRVSLYVWPYGVCLRACKGGDCHDLYLSQKCLPACPAG